MGLGTSLDISSLIHCSKRGYTDARIETTQQESFLVVDGENRNAVHVDQVGSMTRVAGDSTFLFNPDPSSFPAKDTKFSRFVQDHMESNKDSFGEEEEEEVLELESVPPEVVEMAKSNATNGLTCRFLWRNRTVTWGNSMGRVRQRVERCRLARVELTGQGQYGDLHLRRFLYHPTVSRLKAAFMDMREQEKVLSKARMWTPGEVDLVLDPSVSSVFVHEVFGHPAEWDRPTSPASFMIGKKVGSTHLTVEDDPRASGSSVFLAFDDEGITPEPIRIIEKGVLVEGLTSLESAFCHGARPNGRARARDFRHRPLSRMTNIRLLPGEDDPNALIERVDHGLYLMGSLGAIVSPTSYGICCQFGYEIKRGKLGRPVLRPILSGELAQSVASIDGVGNQSPWVEDGGCLAESQFLELSGRGAPHLYLSNVFVS